MLGYKCTWYYNKKSIAKDWIEVRLIELVDI